VRGAAMWNQQLAAGFSGKPKIFRIETTTYCGGAASTTSGRKGCTPAAPAFLRFHYCWLVKDGAHRRV
jgi:hypothetical protein